MGDAGNMTADRDAITREPCCPRCGYEQRGVAESWTDSCPLAGRCSECGLELDWAELFRPDLREPAWCIEHAPRRRDLPWAAITTLLRSFWPWGFWSRLRLSHRMREHRQYLYVFWLVSLPLLCYAVEQAAVAIHVRWQVERAVANSVTAYQQRIRDLQQILAGPPQPPGRGRLPPDESNYLSRELAQLQQMTPNASVQYGYVAAVREAVLFPRRRLSAGQVTFPYGLASYPAPIHLHQGMYMSVQPGGGAGFGRISERFELVLLWLLVAVLLPGSFALLPVSRRRAKLRWRHIARVAAYSAWIPVVLGSVCLLLVAVGAVVPSALDEVVAVIAAVMTVGAPVLLGAWWWAAISRYLRMPHAFFVSVLLLTLCTLAVATVGFGIDALF